MENQTDYIIVDYRQDLDVWVCRWFDFIDSNHLRECYNLIYSQAETQNMHYWLIDIRSRPRAEKEDYDWYFNVFLPEKVASLRGHNYLAYLVTPSHYTYITEMETLVKFEDIKKTATLTTRFFQSEQEALEWLTKSKAFDNLN